MPGPRSTIVAVVWSLLAGGSGACRCGDDPLSLLEAAPRLSPALIDFGDVYVGAQPERTATIENGGDGPLLLGDVRVEGSAAFAVGDHDDVVRAGASVTIPLVFAPTVDGAETGELIVDVGARVPLSIGVVGSGRAPLGCDDGNPCTDDRFDPDAGVCTHTDHDDGPCDDGSACTESDECVDGACLGAAVTCVDADFCTVDACDPGQGCVHFVPDDVCDDGERCTIDRCDPLLGCQTSAAPDGTLCGPLNGCVDIDLCVLGSCQVFPVPDGTPCNDGSICTVTDQCVDALCVGSRIESDPVVVGRARTYGSRFGFAVPLPASRVFFVENALPVASELALGRVDPLLHRLTIESELVVSGVNFAHAATAVAAPTTAEALAFSGRAIFSGDELIVLVTVSPGGALEERGRIEISRDGSGPASLAGRGDLLAWCAERTLALVDIADPEMPVLRSTTDVACSQVTATTTGFALVGIDGLVLVDPADPAAPLLTTAFVGAGFARVIATGEELAVVLDGRAQLVRAGALLEVDSSTNIIDIATGASGELLALTSGSSVRFYDVTGTPALVDDVPVPASDRLGAGGGVVTLSASLPPTYLRLERNTLGIPLVSVTGSQHGNVGRVVATAEGIVAAEVASVRFVDVADPTAPLFRGGVVGTSYSLARVGNDTAVLGSRGGVSFFDVIDATDPAALSVVANGGFDADTVNGAVDDRYAITARARFDGEEESQGIRVAVVDLAGDPSGLELPVTGVTGVDTSSTPFVACLFGSVRDGLAVVQELFGDSLHVFDVSDPALPFWVASVQAPPGVAAAPACRGAASGGRFIVADITTSNVSLFVPSGDGFVPTVTLPAGASEVLLFDGVSAVVGGASALTFLDFGNGVVLGSLEIGRQPTSAAQSSNGHLVIGSTNAVTIVFPPCPPLP